MNNGHKNALGGWKAAALGGLALLAVAGSATAGEAGLAGVQAHVNAAGELRQPSAAEIKAYADAVRSLFATRVATAAQVVQHGDGSISATLGPEALNVWVVTKGADGALRQVCVEGANAAGAVQGAPALEVK